MKKRLLCFLLCIPMLLLSACDKGNIPDNTADNTADLTLFANTDADYSIVYPANATDELKALVTFLRDSAEDITGKRPKAYVDNSEKNPEAVKEILIGSTSRAQSQQSFDAIGNCGYRVEWIGEKLVITGSNDYFLRLAVNELTKGWKAENNTVTLSETLMLTLDGTNLVTSLLDESGAFRYKLVLPKNGSEAVTTAINALRDTIKEITGKRPDQVFAGSASDTEYEILIGDTGRAESEAIHEQISYFNYRIAMSGKRIVVAARMENNLVTALEMLTQDIRKLAQASYSGDYLMNNDYSKEEVLFPWAEGLPATSVGSFNGIYDAADGTFVISHRNIQKNDYQDYLTKLTKTGFEQIETYALGNNQYALMNSEESCVYVSYLAMTGEMRIYAEKAGNATYPSVKEATKGGDQTPAVWQLMTDFKGSGHNSGNSYVLQLTDGSFIIMDGGYNTNAEADQLYKVLSENTPTGQKPVIAAWFITHLHNDHYGALLNFSKRYSSRVEVKSFVYNYTLNKIGSSAVTAVESIDTAMKKWSNAKHYNKIHSGMTMGFADSKATIICTQEDVYPNTPYDANDTCLVVRMDIGGQRIMFLADACASQSRVMSSTIPVSELKSDIVQIAHHGYEGCLVDLYQKIDAKTAFWPMAIYGYKMDTVENVFETWMKKGNTGKYAYANSYLINQSGIQKFFVSGAGTVKLELPYTPTGDRLPDYKAIFNEIKSTDPRS